MYRLPICIVACIGCSTNQNPLPDFTNPQEQLDKKGILVVGRDTTIEQTTPLFISDKGGIVGENKATSKINFRGGYGVMIGWPRGLVPDKHYTKEGFRTFAEAYPIDIGGDLALGPHAPAGVNGYETVRKFKLSITVTKHWAGAWSPVGHLILCGANDADGVVWGGPRPSPILVWIESNKVKLAYKVPDGTVTTIQQDIDQNADTLTLEFPEIQTPNGLFQNTIWPFGFGQAPPAPHAKGYWGNGWTNSIPDITFSKFELNWDARTYKAFWTRPATYVGGLSLPLIDVGHQSYNRSLLVFHKNQTYANSVANEVSIRNVYLWSGSQQPIINIGANMGGTKIENCTVYGGSRGVQSLGNWVHYPLLIRDCNIRNQSDVNIFLFRASGVVIDTTNLAYGNRCSIETCGSNVSIRGPLTMPPPGPPPQTAPFIQHGGRVTYDQCGVDYEYTPAPKAFLRFYPGTYDSADFQTRARLIDCSSGGQDVLVQVMPNQVNYKGKTFLTLHGGPGEDRKILRDGTTEILKDGKPLKW